MTTPSPQTSRLMELDNQQQQKHLTNFTGSFHLCELLRDFLFPPLKVKSIRTCT